MSASIPHSVSDAFFWPTSPKDLVISYFAERVWNEPAIINALGNILNTFKEYGIVHLHVGQTLKPLLTGLGKKPSVTKFVVFPQSEPLCPRDTILGSKLNAKALNSLLQKHLKSSGILQNHGWSETSVSKLKLPILPWLLYLSAKNPEAVLRITSSNLSRILAVDTGFPSWLRKRFKPADCDRHVRRFRNAYAMIRQGRQKRFLEAGGLGSEIAGRHPELAIMYPKSLVALGPRLLNLKESQAVLDLIPFEIIKRQYEKSGFVLEMKPAPKLIPLSKLALFHAGIMPMKGAIAAMTARIPGQLKS